MRSWVSIAVSGFLVASCGASPPTQTSDAGPLGTPFDAGPADAAIDAGIAVDAGPLDAGSPEDGGHSDAGIADAGLREDAGPSDGGSSSRDGGVDAGPLDAGSPEDGGHPDAGIADAGLREDAGPSDGGSSSRDGGVDAGALDAGSADAGAPDSGTADAGVDAGADAGAADAGGDGGSAVADYVVTVDLSSGTALHPYFSGANLEWPANGYDWDDESNPNGLTAAITGQIDGIPDLELGWLRYPAGTGSLAFNWQTGQEGSSPGPVYPFSNADAGFTCADGTTFAGPAGLADWPQEVICAGSNTSFTAPLFTAYQESDMGKLGHTDFGGTADAGFTGFAAAANAGAIITLNTFTDPDGVGLAAEACPANGAPLPDVTFELSNEAYLYQSHWLGLTGVTDCTGTGADHAALCYGNATLPLLQEIQSTLCPGAATTLFFQGWYDGSAGVPTTSNQLTKWDNALGPFAASNGLNGVATHVYPISTTIACSNGQSWPCSTQDDVERLNDVLQNGTNAWVESFMSATGLADARIEISEINVGSESLGDAASAIRGSVYEGIYLAEYVARMSSASPYVTHVGPHQLISSNPTCAEDGACAPPDVHNLGSSFIINTRESWLQEAKAAADTCDGGTACLADSEGQNFRFVLTNMGGAMAVTNGATNRSDTVYATSVTAGGGSPATVGWWSLASSTPPGPTNSGTMPAVFAQGYSGGGTSYHILLTNKSGQVQQVQLNTGSGPIGTYEVSSYCDATTAAPGPDDLTGVYSPPQSQDLNPLPVGPYCVARVDFP